MPVSTGRVSSREAERATFSTVSTNAGAGHRHPLALGLRERREVLRAQRADVEGRGAGEDLDVLLGRPQLERHLVPGERADDVDYQAAGEHDAALAHHLALERDAQADLHVRGAQLDSIRTGEELNAGQRLHGAAGGGRAGHGLELAEKRVAPGRDLHAAAASRVEEIE